MVCLLMPRALFCMISVTIRKVISMMLVETSRAMKTTFLILPSSTGLWLLWYCQELTGRPHDETSPLLLPLLPGKYWRKPWEGAVSRLSSVHKTHSKLSWERFIPSCKEVMQKELDLLLLPGCYKEPICLHVCIWWSCGTDEVRTDQRACKQVEIVFA